jgi:hypothetical protein
MFSSPSEINEDAAQEASGSSPTIIEQQRD